MKIRKICILVLLVILTLPLALAGDKYKQNLHDDLVPQRPDIGLHGKFDVNLWPGASIYSYPLEVPVGTNGLQPSIGIYYNSHSSSQKSGIVGSGWELSQNYIYRDVKNSFSNTSNDVFKIFLNGKSYEIANWTQDLYFYYLNSKIETYEFKIESKMGGNNTNGQYWVLTTKDGTAYRFGYQNNSEQVSNLYSYTTRWSLDLVTDSHGNSVYYSYLENPYSNDSAAVYPYKIEYNNDKKRVIEFILENTDKPYKQVVYEQGNRIRESRQIKEIQIKFDGSLVRKYVLNYTKLDTNRSFLSSITLVGSDNLTALPSTRFDYYYPTPGWSIEKSFLVPSGMSFEFSNGVDSGVRLIDLNRDGLIDLTRSDQSNNNLRQAWLNNGTGWKRNDSWNLPDRITEDTLGTDLGVRLFDVNGDGLEDFIRADGSTRSSRLDSLNGWLNDSAIWHIPVNASFVNSTAQSNDTGVRIADVNGDGLPDLLLATNKSSYAWINNGSGWKQDDSWKVPSAVKFVTIPSETDEGVRIADVNGDGLPDLVKANVTLSIVWINNGSNWFVDGNWSIPAGLRFNDTGQDDTGLRFADLNGDGLEDLVQGKDNGQKQTWINNGSGWVRDPLWDIPESAHFVSSTGTNKLVRIADVNGDGLPDLVNGGDTIAKTFINKASKGYLLKNITNNLGGITTLNYRTSTSSNNSGDDSFGDLGFNLWLVGQVQNNNSLVGAHNISASSYYMYSGGLYDYSSKEFRGFNLVDQIYPNNSIIRHWFNQDSCFFGKEYQTEIYGNSSNLFERRQFQWDGMSGPYCVDYLASVTTFSYDGYYTSPLVTQVNYTYGTYLNLESVAYSGNVSKQGDEKYEYMNNSYNESSWVTRLTHHSLYDSNNTKIAETFYRYDNLSYGAVPTKGDLTWKEDWLNTGNNAVERYEYDSYGNLIKEFDANNHSTSYVYGLRDTTYTFIDQIRNAKNHTFNYWNNLSVGKVNAQSDGNGYTTNYTYDVFGRLRKEIRPYDDINAPTKEYNYSLLDGVSPEMILVSQKHDSTHASYDVRYFYDGLGNLIQEKSEGASSNQSTQDFYYDSLYNLVKKSNPYFSNISLKNNYTSPNQSVASIMYTYDPMQRIIQIKNADNTTKNFTFNKNINVEYDENGNKKEYFLDAYGRITDVIEYVGNNSFITHYRYDSLDNIVQIKDEQGKNVSIYSYDSLNRKLNETHIDSGTWKYAYDAIGNLVNQTSAQNVTTSLTYDELNRISQKKTQQVTVNYTYDAVNGTLTSIITPSATYNYSYDQRLRKANESVSIDGKVFSRSFEYLSSDDVAVEWNPDGEGIKYNYFSALGKITAVARRTTSTTTFITPSDVRYNAAYQPISIPITGGSSINYSYYPDSLRLNQISFINWKNLTYAYDNVGNVIQINDSRNNISDSVIYDGMNRLAKIERKQGNTTSFFSNYTYGSYGNILSVLGKDTLSYASNYYYNLNNAPLKITKKRYYPTLFVNFVNSTPANGSILYENSAYINVSSNSSIDHYTLLDSDQSLVAFWRLEQGNGTFFADEKGRFNGTCVGTSCPSFNSLGYWNGSYRFDKVNDYIKINNNSTFNITKNITISAWFYANYNHSFQNIISKSDGGQDVWELRFNSDGSALQMINKINGTYSSCGSTDSIQANQWYLATWTYDGTTCKLYLNGALNNSVSRSGEMSLGAWDINIGGRANGDLLFNGTVDDTVIFNRTLSGSEILALYNASSNQYSNNFTGLSNGVHTFKAYTVNKNGKLNSTENRLINIQVDLSSPKIAFVSPTPANGSTQNNSSIYVNMTSNSSTSHYSYVNLDRSLVGHWRLEQGNGTFFVDEAGKINGTCSGTSCPTYNSSGYWNGSYSFDGSDDYINLRNSYDTNSSKQMTIASWFYANSLPSYSNFIAKRSSTSGNAEFQFGSLGSSLKLSMPNSGTGSCCTDYRETVTTLTTGRWYFAVADIDTNLHIIKWYVDGINTQNVSITKDWAVVNSNMTLGGSYEGLGEWFPGKIDEITIWNRSLSASEIKSLYNATSNQYSNNFTGLSNGNHLITGYAVDKLGNISKTNDRIFSLQSVAPSKISFVSPTPANGSTQSSSSIYINATSDTAIDHYTLNNFDDSLVAWYRLEQGNGTFFADELGKRNGWCLGGSCPTYNSSGYWNGCYQFDGTNDFINLKNSYNTSSSNQLTLTTWFYASSLPDYSNFIAKRSSTSGNAEFQFGSLGSSLKLSMPIDSGGGCCNDYSEYNTEIQTNRWYFFALTIDTNSNELKWYVDGINTQNDSIYEDFALVNANLSIGSSLEGTGEWFPGKIDDITIWNRTLSPQEITSLYNASANQYRNNFTNLNAGNHIFRAYMADKNGNKYFTEERKVNII